MRSGGSGPGDEEARVKLFALARDEARRLRHGFIDSEHVLLGVIQEAGAAARVLEKQGVSLEMARSEIARRFPPGPAEVPDGQLPLTWKVKKRRGCAK